LFEREKAKLMLWPVGEEDVLAWDVVDEVWSVA